MKSYIYHGKTYYIRESVNAYISPYSLFMIENYPLNISAGSTVCDFGAGTGLLGIIATYYAAGKICFIEIDSQSCDLIRENCKFNQIAEKTPINIIKEAVDCNEVFDTIICNPASLPEFINKGSFCNGGPLGIDMILQVGEFSSKHLKTDGKLFMIITSILPRSIVWNKFKNLGLRWNLVAEKEIAFREHYSGIREWVDNLSKIYPEMKYYVNDGKIYEKIGLYEIWKEGTY